MHHSTHQAHSTASTRYVRSRVDLTDAGPSTLTRRPQAGRRAPQCSYGATICSLLQPVSPSSSNRAAGRTGSAATCAGDRVITRGGGPAAGGGLVGIGGCLFLCGGPVATGTSSRLDGRPPWRCVSGPRHQGAASTAVGTLACRLLSFKTAYGGLHLLRSGIGFEQASDSRQDQWPSRGERSAMLRARRRRRHRGCRRGAAVGGGDAAHRPGRRASRRAADQGPAQHRDQPVGTQVQVRVPPACSARVMLPAVARKAIPAQLAGNHGGVQVLQPSANQ